MATLGAMYGSVSTDTFFGVARAPAGGALTADVALFGADGCTPYPSVGFYCAGGAAAIREAAATYGPTLGHESFDLGGPAIPPGVRLADLGDVPVEPDDPAGNRARITAITERVLAAGAVPVLVGGDDSVPTPFLQAFSAQAPGVLGGPVSILQIDAHIDWRDEVQGERLGLSSTMRRASEMAHVGAIVQVGARGVGSARPGDLADARAADVTFVTARDLHREGPGAALAALPVGVPIVICLDVDALDPSIMPAAIGRAAGGLSHFQVVDLIAGAADRAPIAGIAVAEFMAARDIDGQGALAAAQLLLTMVGIVGRQRAG
jgi:agmatinase